MARTIFSKSLASIFTATGLIGFILAWFTIQGYIIKLDSNEAIYPTHLEQMSTLEIGLNDTVEQRFIADTEGMTDIEFWVDDAVSSGSGQLQLVVIGDSVSVSSIAINSLLTSRVFAIQVPQVIAKGEQVTIQLSLVDASDNDKVGLRIQPNAELDQLGAAFSLNNKSLETHLVFVPKYQDIEHMTVSSYASINAAYKSYSQIAAIRPRWVQISLAISTFASIVGGIWLINYLWHQYWDYSLSKNIIMVIVVVLYLLLL